jgi:hypothetical protein
MMIRTLGLAVDTLDVGYHDQEEVRRTESTPDLGRFEVDGVRFVPKAAPPGELTTF